MQKNTELASNGEEEVGWGTEVKGQKNNLCSGRLVGGNKQSRRDHLLCEQWCSQCNMNLEGGRSQKAQGDATRDRGLDLRSTGRPWKVLCRGKGMAWLGMLLRNPTHATDGEYIWGRQTEQSRGEKTSLD